MASDSCESVIGAGTWNTDGTGITDVVKRFTSDPENMKKADLCIASLSIFCRLARVVLLDYFPVNQSDVFA